MVKSGGSRVIYENTHDGRVVRVIIVQVDWGYVTPLRSTLLYEAVKDVFNNIIDISGTKFI